MVATLGAEILSVSSKFILAFPGSGCFSPGNHSCQVGDIRALGGGWSFLSHGDTPIAGWFIREHPIKIWMI